MSTTGKLGQDQAAAAVDALLAAPFAGQRAQRDELERRRGASSKLEPFPAAVRVVATLFGIKTS
jgi:hypothetical protein